MINFEDLKSQWQNQPEQEMPVEGAKLIVEKVDFLKKKQQIGNMVLLTTIAILVGFFIYVGVYMKAMAAFALILMIVSLITRVIIERFSIKTLKQINITDSSAKFKEKIFTYYNNRIRTHYIITPILILCYCSGFVMLLPFFKQDLSYGFYIYIVVSGMIVLSVLILFIRKQILKELMILRDLKE